MSIFEAYDSEFSSINQEIIRSISDLKDNIGDADKANSSIRLIEGLFSQSNDLIKQMELEARSNDQATRKVLNEKVNLYKKSSLSVKQDFNKTKLQVEKDELLHNNSKTCEQRQRLMDTNDRMSRQDEMISNAHRTVNETEEVGMEITAELARNREKIESSRAKANEFAGITDSARRMIGSMGRRDLRNRFIIFGVAGALIVLISVTIYATS